MSHERGSQVSHHLFLYSLDKNALFSLPIIYLVLHIFLFISTTAHSVLSLPVILSSGPRSVCLTAPPLPCAHELRRRDIFFEFSHSQTMALLL